MTKAGKAGWCDAPGFARLLIGGLYLRLADFDGPLGKALPRGNKYNMATISGLDDVATQDKFIGSH
ncbi:MULTISPECIES: hypothetical protein [unclassified Agrobacterium]|uniref:Uncharacterized protein n=1 Tax=Agrobacterium fabrum TaxID=1176649 RepID=A0A2W5FJN5_9HYPH|nr:MULTISPECIES: hypothetical protein [unclassified Agrobacterium]PZP53960.1 MAG: hypothetical protein DI595_01700 [Agrobacterium fabrum]MDH0612242.1 hypothetical protein [Agrobacterium sp. GD03872]MDH0696139.1 hypothetical protein [Agrobacterium sp. GD03871]MDH1059041.1 hypothetical protein [Agrobacterium sp. GD03992]MDH2210403.1 hypothetical protein [Agrobacterium sp. GD03643]